MRGCNQLLNDLCLLLIKLIANFTHPNCGNMNMNFKKETSLHLPHAAINVGEIESPLSKWGCHSQHLSSAVHPDSTRHWSGDRSSFTSDLLTVRLRSETQGGHVTHGFSQEHWCTHSCSIRKQILLRCISIHSKPAICWSSIKLVELCCFGFSIYYNLACGYFYQFSFVDIDQPIFQPYPSELVFQNFTPTQTYSLQLSLFNNDKVCKGLTNKRMGQRKHSLWTQKSFFFFCLKVSRKVRLELQDSEFFQVTGLKSDGCKVAPGMSAAFYVCFTPQENKVLGTFIAKK